VPHSRRQTSARSGGSSRCETASVTSRDRICSTLKAASTRYRTWSGSWAGTTSRREQGLIVAPGNPLGLAGIDDLRRPGLRYVNRQRGAGTRVLLDHELARRGIRPEAIEGYTREEYTHLAVAAAVAAGRADCGLGVLAAARAFELDFVSVASEPYDLVLYEVTLADPVLAPLLALLEDADFRTEVEALGGYDASEMGRRIR
jgi:putative molybdopterin biosynthesis protein